MAAITQSIGLFGVTGELGRAFLDALVAQEAFVGRLRIFASERSSEETRLYRERPLIVEVADGADFSDITEAILAVPADVADDLAQRLIASGVRVWDATGHLRGHHLAVSLSEANADSHLIVLDDGLVNILAPLATALDALSPLTRLDITVLAPVSLRGHAGVRELARQTGELLNGRGISTEIWPQQIAFNVLAADSSFEVNGLTARERKLLQGLQKRLPAARIQIRQLVVPVFYGAVMDVRWSHESAVARTAVLAACKKLPSLKLYDKTDAKQLPSPVGEGVDNEEAVLSRLQVLELDGAVTVLADPARVGIVRPLLATLLDQG